MEKSVIDLLERLSFHDSEIPHFPREGYTPVKLSKENFHKIKKSDSPNLIAFIDGGNQEITGAHNFSLQMIRLYYCIYQNNKRIKKNTYEAFVLINAIKKEKSISYEVKISSGDALGIDKMSFDAYDATLSTGGRMVKVESIGEISRKFLEIKLATKLCQELKNGFIVLDTTLEATVNGEKKLFDEMYKASMENNVMISALSKTTSLLTESGNSVIAILNSLNVDGEWYYHPLVKIDNHDHKAEVYIVKLNEKSKYVFRLEANNPESDKIEILLSLLYLNSKDPVFLGYPYGLIEADKFARVQNKEVDVKRTQLFMKLGKNFEKLKNYLNTKNAHNILDNIK